MRSTPPYDEIACLRRAIRRFEVQSERVARREGAGPRSYLVLLAIKGSSGEGRLLASEVAEFLQLERHSASGAIARCEAAGLVRREPCTEDGRRTWVSLTPDGERVVRQVATQLEADRLALVEEVVRCAPSLTRSNEEAVR